MAETEDYDKSATPTAHKTSHQDGGLDEISVLGLSGLLGDSQTPLAHKASHQDGGADEISVTGLSGLLADAQTPLAHKTSHQDLGSDEISVTGLSGLLADGQHVLSPEVETVITSRQKAKAYRNAAQSIPDTTWTKVEVDIDDFDPSNITDLVNNRIIPTKAGYYMVFGQAGVAPAGFTAEIIVAIYKNGAEVVRGGRMASTSIVSLNCGGVVYMNGSTDYLELYFYQNSGATRALEVGYPQLGFIAVVGPF